MRSTIRTRRLIEPGMRVLAACSGGPDSGAMLMVLARLSPELGFELEAASVDHGLRAGAARDVEIAQAQAHAARVAFHTLRLALNDSSADSPQARARQVGSLQARAREARYAALSALARERGAARIAVGHTREDQAETVLLRVLRGAGVLGLSGIEPRRADGVIRPLMDCERGAVAAFAAAHCPEVAQDPSNGDPRFERARLRHALMPSLLAYDSALVEHLCDLAEDARALREALQPHALALLDASGQDSEKIDLSLWAEAPSAIRRAALRLWLEPRIGAELGRAHLEQLERAAEGGGEVWLPRGFRVRGDRGRTLALGSAAAGRAEPNQASDQVCAVAPSVHVRGIEKA